MKQNSKRLVSMVLALVLLVAAFLIFFDLIQPTYGDLEAQKGQEASSESFLQSEQAVVNQAKTLLAQYESESQGQASLALAMPSGPDVAGAIAQVYGIAVNNGITVSSIGIAAPSVQIQPPQNTGDGSTPLTASQIVKPVGILSFQIAAAGSYENLKSFLSQLETNIRIFDVTAISVQPETDVTTGAKQVLAGTTDFFTYTLTVVTYYQLP